MNIKITDLDMILNYLETTSLEPHDDYTSEFTYKDQKILYKYIKQLQQVSKHLKDNWNKLKEVFEKEGFEVNTKEYGTMEVISKDLIFETVQELEQGSDSNE